MSEAEQSREPQRDETEGAGLAGKGEDSAVGAGGGSGDSKPEDAGEAPGGAARGGTVTAPQSGASDAGAGDETPSGETSSGDVSSDEASAGELSSADVKPSDAGVGEAAAAEDPAAGTGDGDADEVGSDAGDAPAADDVTAAGAAKDVTGTTTGNGDAAPSGAAKAGADVASDSADGNGPRDGGAAATGAGESASGGGAAATNAGKDATGVAESGTRRGAAGAGAKKAAPSGAKAPEGRLLAGRYRLGGVLGRGGMGTVWRAVDETLGRTVAVKELRFPNAIDEEEKRRLITRTLREAKAIARIRNNSAVTVYDVVDEDDRPWIVMELVEGKSLAEVVREDGVLTPRRAAEVGLAILDVLRSAHREGILHRDVKPSNVLIGKDGRVVLTDFGIAQVEGDPSITSTGMLVGAPSYISPERARGHKPGPAADLWSLGGLLYASVEGSPPYDKGSAIATLTAVMTEPLDPPKNAGPLEEVIYGLLAKDPAQRLDDAGARALLTQVVNAPEAPVRTAEIEAPVEQTRAIRIPPVPPVLPAPRPDAKPKDPAAERLRGALRSVRNAAAAAKTESRSEAGGGTRTATTAGAPTASAAPSSGKPAPVRAPLTDVVPRRTLVIIAVVAALVVLSTVLVFAFGGDDKANEGKGKDDTAASAGSTAGGDGKAASGGSGGAQTPDSSAGTGEETTDGGSDGAPGSNGSQGSGTDRSDDGTDAGDEQSTVAYRHDQGFSIGLPKGWKHTGTDKAGARFSGPDGQRLLVGWTTSPKSNPVADWTAQEAWMRRDNYKRVSIKAVEYRGWTAADWEFTFTEGGTKYRSVDRGFVVRRDLGYGIMFTARDAGWAEADVTLQTFFKTFQPKAG
ncbi:tRNA A-37 threonylcarbamoyl transferase component Bud32 [Streptomyces sp. V4I23]|uniref:serine/threonine-protein kinase n=1 Tax=Streptomyces sp. V4I23 TaxID=3042282 RepID=UPI0027893AF3|nr:tRNA A-37 threonylcarbamoyl transferase component Bud32 [Streptomyces sp. V4I23]